MYYGRACDPCILPALNEIATEQASPTTETIERTKMLMDYLHTYPEAVIRYYASDMILKITSDAAYLVQPKARSRIAAHFHLSWTISSRKNGPLRSCARPSKTSSHPPPKPKPAVFTWLANTLSPSVQPLSNSVTPSRQHPSKQTTRPPKAFSTPK